MFCIEGTVYDKEITKVLGHYYCDIDAYDDQTNCTPDGCYYYVRKQESEGKK